MCLLVSLRRQKIPSAQVSSGNKSLQHMGWDLNPECRRKPSPFPNQDQFSGRARDPCSLHKLAWGTYVFGKRHTCWLQEEAVRENWSYLSVRLIKSCCQMLNLLSYWLQFKSFTNKWRYRRWKVYGCSQLGETQHTCVHCGQFLHFG